MNYVLDQEIERRAGLASPPFNFFYPLAGLPTMAILVVLCTTRAESIRSFSTHLKLSCTST
jgi:hypothetical protein